MEVSGGAKGGDLLAVGSALLLGAVVRALFVASAGLPVFDPWRHLLLLQHLRSGAGFTLFEGQPYIWYGPAWYWLCALLPGDAAPIALATLLSWLCVPAVYFWLRRVEGEGSRHVATAGALLVAGFGPLVAFTCHLGPEAFSLCLVLAAVLVATVTSGAAGAAASGLLFGVALAARLNLAFDAFLMLPVLRTRRRALSMASACAVPLLATWWRNHRAIASYPYLFTWDGLATRTSDFNVVSTLVLQMHPAIRQGLRRLHDQIVPWPEWIAGPSGIAWGPLLFMVCGAVCLVLARRLALALAGFSTLVYFLLLDGSRSAHFYRIWLGVFPVYLAAIAIVSGAIRRQRARGTAVAAWGLVAAVLVTGAPFLVPPRMVPIEMVTPPPELLTESAYMVNSGFYHPESLMARFPDKRFIGMPLDPAEFEDFRKHFPGYRSILWHPFSVQDDLLKYLLSAGGYRVAAEATNEYGRRYLVLSPDGLTARPSSGAGGGGGSSTR